jgi:hypothetical protein
MSLRKQQLLSRHRRHKRIFLLASLAGLVAIGVFAVWWLVPLLLLLGWIAHEAWFADHLFYSPQDDYQYGFPPEAARQSVSLVKGRLQLSVPAGGRRDLDT